MMALEKKKSQIRNINNLPCDISEAKSDTSERIFATSTAAVTQELATCRRDINQLKELITKYSQVLLMHSFLISNSFFPRG
jgi:DNA repair exonuclease SbcCD ATPase subunit